METGVLRATSASENKNKIQEMHELIEDTYMHFPTREKEELYFPKWLEAASHPSGGSLRAAAEADDSSLISAGLLFFSAVFYTVTPLACFH